jgi:hypothetical protein
MNFNDQTVFWDTENRNYSNERHRYNTLSSAEAMIEVYMTANEPQTLRDEYSRATEF